MEQTRTERVAEPERSREEWLVRAHQLSAKAEAVLAVPPAADRVMAPAEIHERLATMGRRTRSAGR